MRYRLPRNKNRCQRNKSKLVRISIALSSSVTQDHDNERTFTVTKTSHILWSVWALISKWFYWDFNIYHSVLCFGVLSLARCEFDKAKIAYWSIEQESIIVRLQTYSLSYQVLFNDFFHICDFYLLQIYMIDASMRHMYWSLHCF